MTKDEQKEEEDGDGGAGERAGRLPIAVTDE